LRATNRPSNGLPYTRVLAAFMLATLISTIFALPAFAAANELTVTNVGSVAKVLPNGTITYTVTIANIDGTGAAATNVVFTDTVGVGTLNTVTPPAGTVCTPIVGNATTCTTATLPDATSAVITFNVTAPAGVEGELRVRGPMLLKG